MTLTLPPKTESAPVRAIAEPLPPTETDIERAYALSEQMSYDEMIVEAYMKHGAEAVARAEQEGWLSVALLAI